MALAAPLSLERLSRREDGRLAYKLKRPAPTVPPTWW